MSNDKVTIVIPVYNSEKFLIPTIESALNQSYQNLEIIAVDDDSTKEKYLTALKDYKKNKPLGKKTLDLGLKIIKDSMPDWATDKILVFYLNKIRISR